MLANFKGIMSFINVIVGAALSMSLLVHHDHEGSYI